jgi:hypothetical protein
MLVLYVTITTGQTLTISTTYAVSCSCFGSDVNLVSRQTGRKLYTCQGLEIILCLLQLL